MAETEDAQLFPLLHAAGSLEAAVESRLSAIGLSLPKLAALCQLVSAGGTLLLGQLAERLSCVKSNVTQLVDRLEADGLVARTLDANDRRSRLAVITDTGRQAFERGTRIQRDVERELFGVLSPDESAQLTAIIRKLDGRGAYDATASVSIRQK